MGILSLIAPAFETQASAPAPGGMYWVPTSYVEEVPRVLTVSRANPREHGHVDFELAEVGPSHFRGDRQLPLSALSLSGNEELMVAKGKRRPCVVLASAIIEDVDSIRDSTQQRQAGTLGRQCYVVAP